MTHSFSTQQLHNFLTQKNVPSHTRRTLLGMWKGEPEGMYSVLSFLEKRGWLITEPFDCNICGHTYQYKLKEK